MISFHLTNNHLYIYEGDTKRRCNVTMKCFRWIIDVDDDTRLIVAQLVDHLWSQGWIKYDYTVIKDQIVQFNLHCIDSAVTGINDVRLSPRPNDWLHEFINTRGVNRPIITTLTWNGYTATDGVRSLTIGINDHVITIETNFTMEYGNPGYGVFHDIVRKLIKCHGHPIRLILPGTYQKYQLTSEPSFDDAIIDEITKTDITMTTVD